MILLCGVLFFIATPLCHAQDAGKLFEVKTLQAEVSSALTPAITSSAALGTAIEKPVKEVSERPWYWRFMEGIVMSAAKYNTEKQSDGRPLPQSNPR